MEQDRKVFPPLQLFSTQVMMDLTWRFFSSNAQGGKSKAGDPGKDPRQLQTFNTDIFDGLAFRLGRRKQSLCPKLKSLFFDWRLMRQLVTRNQQLFLAGVSCEGHTNSQESKLGHPLHSQWKAFKGRNRKGCWEEERRCPQVTHPWGQARPTKEEYEGGGGGTYKSTEVRFHRKQEVWKKRPGLGCP